MTITNFFNERGGNRRRSDREVNDILARPEYTRRDMLALTRPRVDSAKLQSWLRRGYLRFEMKPCIGNSDEYRHWADVMEANDALGIHRRYSGGDALACMTLDAISQAGLPFDLSHELIGAVWQRAQMVLQGDTEPAVLLVYQHDGAYKIKPLRRVPRPENLHHDWFSVINIDRIIARFLSVALK